MARVLIVAGLLAFAFAVYAIVDCALSAGDRVRGLPRWAWILVVAVLPVVGGVLWFLIGSGRRQPVRPASRVIGPDDDPEFLRSRGGRAPRTAAPTAPAADDEQWQRLEQELAGLDADADQDEDPEGRRH